MMEHLQMELKTIPFIKAKEDWVFGKVLDVSEGDYVILIQDKKAALVKYHYPTENEPFITFSHPLNHVFLDNEITSILRNQEPNILKTEEAVIYYCPIKWGEKSVW